MHKVYGHTNEASIDVYTHHIVTRQVRKFSNKYSSATQYWWVVAHSAILF